jgi:magnesium-transporting ATPase (P-type)
MGQHSNFQHSFWDVVQEVTYHCIWTMISVGVILRDKRILSRRGLPYTLKSPNKQLMHTFLYFVVSLQSIFYTFVLFFVFNVYIYSSSLIKVIYDWSCRKSSTSNPSTIFHVSVVFALTLASRYFCFKYHDCFKRVIYQASDIAKILISINVLVIL